MSHPAAQAVSILDAAAALGLKVDGRRTRCFNASGHKSGRDENPSLTLYADSNRFKCYACGVAGDVIDLVKGVHGVEFKEAVTWVRGLSQGANACRVAVVTPPVRTSRCPDKPATEVYAALYEMSFEIGPEMPAGKYLAKRGIALTLAKQHHVTQLGNVGRVWQELVDRFGLERLRAAGLVSRADNFLFAWHSLLFFYFREGWPVYVQARDLTGTSRNKELSLAGLHSSVPYNVDVVAERHEHLCVCEGCIDTLSALQLGYAAVGVPGVVSFRPEWFDLFRNARHVCVLFDNDAAGQRQAVELRSQFRLHGIKADAWHPATVKDMNDVLLKLKG